MFSAPPRAWLVERIATIQTVLERRTERSALLLRKVLGPIRMEPVTPDIGRPYYRAVSDLDVLAIVENDPDSSDSEPGSNSLQWWTRSQRIRTAARLSFQIAILEIQEPPAYQLIADKAFNLSRLGLIHSRISKLLGVTDKTVAKAISWRS